MEKPIKILVVDDEEPVRGMLSVFLEGMGHSVATAANGFQALAMLQTGGYDIVVSDVTMPQMNGLQLLESIRKHYEGVLVILMSGGVKSHLEAEALSKGAYAFVSKPPDLRMLRAIVDGAVVKLGFESHGHGESSL